MTAVAPEPEAEPAAELVGASLRPPALEAEFRARSLRGDGLVAAVVVAGMALAMALELQRTLAAGGGPGTAGRHLALQVAFLAWSAACVALSLRSRRPALVDGALFGWVLLGIAHHVVTLATHAVVHEFRLLEFCFATLLVWVILPGRYWLQGLAGLVVTLGGAAWLALAHARAPGPADGLLSLAVVLVNVPAALLSWRMHRARRRTFLTHREVEVAHRRLQATLRENEQLVVELRQALQQVKTLSGLLPICMYCHKVRDEEGGWERIERYVARRTDALFSHGMCPECARQHFGE